MEDEGRKPKIKLMVPMVNSNADLDLVRQMLEEECSKQGEKTKIPVGAMIETVAGVHALKRGKLNADFISVGSNDLIAKIIGPDRYSDENLEAYDPTEPAVLETLKDIATAANKQNLPVSICGEMASHTKYTGLLLGAGFRNLSAGVDSIPYIKKMATRNDISEAERLFETVSNTDDKDTRDAILAHYNDRLGFPHSGDVILNWQATASNDKWEPPLAGIE